jgi:hypothetical protein
MKLQSDAELRKRAAAVALRRILGVNQFDPVVMLPPPGEALFKSFTLSSGVTYSPNFSRGGQVVVNLEADAIELEREGWQNATTKARAYFIATGLISMLSPRAGTFRGASGRSYAADHEGQELQVTPADLAGMKRQGFTVLS